MRYLIKKMFRRDPANGDLHGVNVVFTRDDGQMRKLQGKIGTHVSDGEYTMEVRGNGLLTIEMEPTTTLHIIPVTK